jgi:hypothetical protein
MRCGQWEKRLRTMGERFLCQWDGEGAFLPLPRAVECWDAGGQGLAGENPLFGSDVASTGLNLPFAGICQVSMSAAFTGNSYNLGPRGSRQLSYRVTCPNNSLAFNSAGAMIFSAREATTSSRFWYR